MTEKSARWPKLACMMPGHVHRLASIAVVFTMMMCMIATGQETALSGASVIHLPVAQGRILRFNEPIESVLVADTTIADVQVVAPDIVYLYGLNPGRTNLIALTADQRVEASAELRVAVDSTAANQANRARAPTSSTDIAVIGDRLLIQGTSRSVGDAIESNTIARSFTQSGQAPAIDNSVIEGAQQVNIRVRFAEVSRTELESYGVDWSVGYASGGFEFGILGDNAVPAPGGGNLGVGLSDTSGFNFDVLIEALKRNGIVTILAEPNLTAVTGRTASFLAGGEIPVPVPQSSDTVTIEYKPFGVSLTFTPTLLPNGRIALHVRPEASTLSATGTSVSVNGFNLPSFVVRRVDTTVEVASGQTFAIAGLFQQSFTRNIERFPVLGDVPILGSLFRSQRFQKEETELVVLITPYLVEPVRGRDLATPIDRAAGGTKRQAPRRSSMGLIVK